MNNLKFFFQVYLRPGRAVSDLMDRGNWVVSVVLFLLVSAAFHFAVVIPNATSDSAITGAPFIGAVLTTLLDSGTAGFLTPLVTISVFFIPLLVYFVSLFGNLDEYGDTLRREYGTLGTCLFTLFAAAHLPFAILAFVLPISGTAPLYFLACWLGAELLFGFLVVFLVRTAFGLSYRLAAGIAAAASLSYLVAGFVFLYLSPLFLLPIVGAYAVLLLVDRFRRNREFRRSVLPEQLYRRLLREAEINPNNADARVQLAFVYRRRFRPEKEIEHFRHALMIDPQEVDANYELGKIARHEAKLQGALDHFTAVIERDDTHSLNEIWREIGAVYLSANMFGEARKALSTFIERRPFDAEGLYYLGKAIKAEGTDMEAARQVFEQAVESVRVSPVYRRRHISRWAKLAEKEI